MSLMDFFTICIMGGLAWFLSDRYLPFPALVKTVITVIFIIAFLFLVLALFGVVQLPFPIR